MKKFLVFILAIIAMQILSAAEICFSPKKSIAGCSIVQPAERGECVYSFSDCFNEDADEFLLESMSVIKMKNTDVYSESGSPMLAKRAMKIELDGHFEISGINIESGNYVSGYTAKNVRRHSKKHKWHKDYNAADRTVVNSDSFYPGKWVSYNSGFDGSRTIVYLQILPLQWNPATREIYQLKDYTLNIYGQQIQAENNDRSINPVNDEHIIIVPAAWETVADSMAAFNTSLGVSTSTVTIDEISADYSPVSEPTNSGYATDTNTNIVNYQYEDARKIVAYLRDTQAHPNLQYITIAGSGEAVPPSYYFYFNDIEMEEDSYNAWIPSDIFYSSPDFDWVENYSLARIPVSTEAEFSAYYHKMMNWHSSWNSTWTNNASVGGGPAFLSPFVIGELMCNQIISDELLSGYNIEKFYHSRGNLSRSDILQHLQNNNFLLHLQINHGSGDAFCFDDETYLSVSDILALPQKDELPVILSVACMNGAFDTAIYPGEWNGMSFSESVIKSAGAGIAYVGGSRTNGGDALFDYNGGNLQYTGTTDIYSMLYSFINGYRMTPNPTFGSLARSAREDFLLNNDLSASFYNESAYVRFVCLANSGMLLPQAPAAVYSNSVPQIELDGFQGVEEFYQYKAYSGAVNPSYSVFSADFYDLRAYKLEMVEFQGEEYLSDIVSISEQENINSNFAFNCSDSELLVLSRLESPDYKEAWHWSKLNGTTDSDENNVNNREALSMTNYPNPFNPETTISFKLPDDKTDVELSVYNIKGQRVKTLVNDSFDSGTHSIIWNGTDSSSKKVGSGLYFYKLTTDNKSIIGKMIMMK